MSFFDPVESGFYGSCLEGLLTSPRLVPLLSDGLVEIGAGTAVPVIEALRRSESTASVRGFELDEPSFRIASRMIEKAGLPNYTVACGDFFASVDQLPERCAVGNPPYLPAPNQAMGAPELWGGDDGAAVSRRVLSSGFDVVMLMVASISDPRGLLEHARRAGYSVFDWSARPISFGRYSWDAAVRGTIDALGRGGKASFTATSYVLAGVTWVRRDSALGAAAPDQSAVLARVLTTETTDGTTGGTTGGTTARPMHGTLASSS
jgi:hypothetical protein